MRLRTVVLGLLAAGALVLAVERLVVTDREAIEELLETGAAAFRGGDFQTLTECLSPDFEAQDRDRAAAIAYARRLRSRYAPMDLRVIPRHIEIEGDRARVRLDVTARVLARRGGVHLAALLAHESQGWRVTWLQPLAPDDEWPNKVRATFGGESGR